MTGHHIGCDLAVMSTASAGHRDSPGWYEIRIQGHLDERWVTWFDGMTLTTHSDGTTLLRGRVIDQAALHGLLHTLRGTGLPLVSVTQVEADPRAVDPTTVQLHTSDTDPAPGD
jgi:hypothetical protein